MLGFQATPLRQIILNCMTSVLTSNIKLKLSLYLKTLIFLYRNPFIVPSRRTVFGRFRRLHDRLEDEDLDQDEDDSTEPYILTDEEILYKHWKLSVHKILLNLYKV